jgi:hypothetical protein
VPSAVQVLLQSYGVVMFTIVGAVNQGDASFSMPSTVASISLRVHLARENIGA